MQIQYKPKKKDEPGRMFLFIPRHCEDCNKDIWLEFVPKRFIAPRCPTCDEFIFQTDWGVIPFFGYIIGFVFLVVYLAAINF